MSILYIRHGSTDRNEATPGPERTRGLDNIPMAPLGHQEAQQAAQISQGFQLKAILSSDLDRAMGTTDYVSKVHPKVPVIPTAALRPWNVGHLTGQEYKDATPVLNDHLQHPDEAIPGGDSFYGYVNQQLPLLQHLIERPEVYGVVGHNWTGRILRALAPSGGTELDHSIVAQKNPIHPGHLAFVGQDYKLEHFKPSGPPPAPNSQASG